MEGIGDPKRKLQLIIVLLVYVAMYFIFNDWIAARCWRTLRGHSTCGSSSLETIFLVGLLVAYALGIAVWLKGIRLHWRNRTLSLGFRFKVVAMILLPICWLMIMTAFIDRSAEQERSRRIIQQLRSQEGLASRTPDGEATVQPGPVNNRRERRKDRGR